MDDALDLYIVDSQPGMNEAVIVGRRRGDIAIGRVDLVSPAAMALTGFTTRVEDVVTAGAVRPTEAELRQVGQDLFDYLFKDDLLDLYTRAANDPISIQIVTNHPTVHRMPWEFLLPKDQPSVPNANRTVARILPICAPPTPPRRKLKGKLRVLLAVADPINLPGVGWADVEANVRRPLEAQTDSVATLKVIPGASPEALLHALNSEDYDVFHFLGHGVLGKDNRGALELVDVDTKKQETMAASDVAAVLSGRKLRLCILSACLTGAGNVRDPFGPVATTLLRAGIPAVVANQTSLPTKSVAPFVGALYLRLLRDGNIDNAVMAGRHALNIELRASIPHGNAVVEWGIPSLFRLPGAAQLF